MPEINPPATCSSYVGLNLREDKTLRTDNSSGPTTPSSSNSTENTILEDTEFTLKRKRKISAIDQRKIK